MANRIVLNPVSYHGAGTVKEIGGELSRRGYKRAFIASGRHVVKSGEIKKITDVEKKRKFVCVDVNDIPEVAVVDPEMMYSMPKPLTAATGMDALTHAIKGYITKGHCEISDMFHLEAIHLIAKNLRAAVENDPCGREGMALGQYIAGMGFLTLASASSTPWPTACPPCTTRPTASPARSCCPSVSSSTCPSPASATAPSAAPWRSPTLTA